MTNARVFSTVVVLKSAAIVAFPAVALGVQVPVQLNTAAPVLGCRAVLTDGPVVTVTPAPGEEGPLMTWGVYANIVPTGLCTCDS